MTPFETSAPPTERITTRRAVLGRDLWTAIEAAQFARIILCEEPRTDAERDVQAAFVDTLTRHVEDWEETAPLAQATALEGIGRCLVDLERVGFRVHWCVTERMMPDDDEADEPDEPDEPHRPMPLAVVIVDRTDDAELTVELPLDLDMVDPTEDQPPQD